MRMCALSMFFLSLVGTVQPVWAGHGTIEETDNQIIVEYFGDAAEKGGTASPAPQIVANAAGSNAISAEEAAENARRDKAILDYYDIRNEHRRLAGEDRSGNRTSSRRTRSRSGASTNLE